MNDQDDDTHTVVHTFPNADKSQEQVDLFLAAVRPSFPPPLKEMETFADFMPFPQNAGDHFTKEQLEKYYSAPHLSAMMKQAPTFAAADANTPPTAVAAIEFPPKDGKFGLRNYKTGSYRALFDFLKATPIDKRTGYEVIRPGPCRAYLDVDLDTGAHLTKDGDFALAVFYYYLRPILETRYGVKWEDILVSTVNGTKPLKYSKHVVFHLPGDLMFANNKHFGELVDDILRQSILDMGYSHNPLLYTEAKDNINGVHLFSVRSIIDSQVYTRNRCFRFIFNCKAGSTYQLVGVCDNADAAGGAAEGCKCSGCHIDGLTIGRFLSTLVQYHPPCRLKHGLNYNLIEYRTGDYSNHRFNPATDPVTKLSDGNFSADVAQTHYRHFAGVRRAADGAEDDSSEDDADLGGNNGAVTLRTLAGIVRDEINRHSKESDVYIASRGIHANGTVLMPSNGYTCIYKPKGVNHRHNHPYFVVHLSYPHPVIFHSCNSNKCIAVYGGVRAGASNGVGGKGKVEFPRGADGASGDRRVRMEIPAERWELYTQKMREYIDNHVLEPADIQAAYNAMADSDSEPPAKKIKTDDDNDNE